MEGVSWYFVLGILYQLADSVTKTSRGFHYSQPVSSDIVEPCGVERDKQLR
jgi:hypothetical protein